MRLIGLRCTTQTAKGVKHENGKETERKKKGIIGKGLYVASAPRVSVMAANSWSIHLDRLARLVEIKKLR